MKTAELNLLDWQERFGTEASCAQALAQQRAGHRDSAARAAGTTTAMLSPPAIPMNARIAITRPR